MEGEELLRPSDTDVTHGIGMAIKSTKNATVGQFKNCVILCYYQACDT